MEFEEAAGKPADEAKRIAAEMEKERTRQEELERDDSLREGRAPTPRAARFQR